MGSRYLTDLADVIRRADLVVHEISGWQTRGRSSGGFNSPQPTYIMCHHTASSPGSDGASDANYIATGSDIAPISQLYINRDGEVWVCAAGACNNAGSGGPHGSVPQDSMNTYSIALEVANNGVGEPWPEIQQQAYQLVVQTLMARYGIPTANICAHFEWAPTRKIDPAGSSRWATGAASWNMAAFRSDAAAGWPDQPPTPTPPDPGPTPTPTPYPGLAQRYDRGAVVLDWQEAMIYGGWISDNPSNRDSYYGDGMYGAVLKMQQGFGWSDADGVAGDHTWAHMTTRGAPPCPRCGR